MIKKCPKEGCPNWFEPTKKHGYETKYCSRSCANSRNFTQATRDLKSEKILVWLDSLSDVERKKLFGENIFKAQKIRQQQQFDCLMTDSIEEMSHERRRKRILVEQHGKCNRCGIDEWLGEPISLELEHIDGDSNNNVRENVECLCPNCHSLTPTWRGRNKNGKNGIRVTDQEIIEALQTTENIRQALLKIGIAAKGGNYNRAKKLLEQMDP